MTGQEREVLPTVAMHRDEATESRPARTDLLERLSLAPLGKCLLPKVEQGRTPTLPLLAHQPTIQRIAASPPTKRGLHDKQYIGPV